MQFEVYATLACAMRVVCVRVVDPPNWCFWTKLKYKAIPSFGGAARLCKTVGDEAIACCTAPYKKLLS
eukprot:scaffold256298_cov47-Attheya_sp.AAC.1